MELWLNISDFCGNQSLKLTGKLVACAVTCHKTINGLRGGNRINLNLEDLS